MKLDPHQSAGAPDGSDAQILRIAAEWRTRHDAGLTPAEYAEFQCWLEQDPRNAEFFDEMERTWSLLDRAGELSPQAIGLRNSSDATEVQRPRHHRLLYLTGGLAAALVAALIIGLAYQPTDRTVQFADSTTPDAGIFKRVNLPDGSVVRLQASSAIAVEFTSRQRRVRLYRGGAHFSVAKDPARPFVVEASGVDVRAVGTAFSVAKTNTGVEVLVSEGKVGVESALTGAVHETLLPQTTTGVAPVLSVGEKAMVPIPTPSVPVPVAAVQRLSGGELAAAMAWQERHLEFEGAPLAEIVAEINRYNHQRLIIGDSALANRRFGGTFRADEPDEFLALLSASSKVRIERHSDQIILYSLR